MSKKPFTKEEKEVLDLLVKAHNKFVKLDRGHPTEMIEWVDAFHRLQDLLGSRILRRDYPNIFR